jgi:type 1 fimbria pilin
MFMKKALADRTLFKSGASVITQFKSILLTAIVGSLAAGAVQASTSANLEVSGRLVPAACAISLGNKGVFDLGITPAGMISRTATTLLPPLITTLTIRCPQETFVYGRCSPGFERPGTVGRGGEDRRVHGGARR